MRTSQIEKLAGQYEEYVITQRRWFHRHPELSWQETETTRHIADELNNMGITPSFYPDGRTGLTAMIQGGRAEKGAKTILLRADIDALPVTEMSGAPYSSRNPGVMHACGHDCHAAMLLGAARILKELEPELTGNVKLFFQGAEETAIGAKYYVEQGVLADVQAVYGCHVNIDYPAGTIKLFEGNCMPSCDEFSITVNGVSSHGALPHQGKDAIVAAANVVMNLQTLVSRTNDPMNPLVVSVGRIEGGQQYNIIANQVHIKGTVRTFNGEIRQKMDQLIREVAQPAAAALGCTATVDYAWKTGPVIHNDPRMNALVRAAAEELYGEENLCRVSHSTFSDDFAYLTEGVPAFYAMIGVRNEQMDCVYPHHHEKFNVDESALRLGCAMFVQVAENFFRDGCPL